MFGADSLIDISMYCGQYLHLKLAMAWGNFYLIGQLVVWAIKCLMSLYRNQTRHLDYAFEGGTTPLT